MIVLVPKTSGFCPGVKRAEEGVFKIREEEDCVNLYGPLIHNRNYMSMLQEHNINAVDIENLKKGDTLVVRTHGISRFEEKELSKTFILKDMTCPIVKRVQRHIEKASQEKSFVIISGKSNHAEVQGLVSYADHYLVIEGESDLQQFLAHTDTVIPKECTQVFVLSQTTHSRVFFQHLCLQIKTVVSHLPVVIKDTICPITENKEQESLLLQKEVDFTIVIGDPHSSNSKKLYAVLKNEQTIFIQNLACLKAQNIQWQGIHKVLVVSSTSTPLFIEKEIVDYLEQL